VSPAKPTATDSIKVSFRAPATVAKHARYRVILDVPANGQCTASMQQTTSRPVRAGAIVTVELTASRYGIAAGWCSGRATVRLAYDRRGGGWPPIPGTRHRFTIGRSAYFRPAPLGTKVSIDVLPTSTSTVTAPGRADRILGLGGVMNGFIGGKFVLNAGFKIGLGGDENPLDGSWHTNDAIVVASLVTDPLCSAPAVRTLAPVTHASVSSLSFPPSGAVTGTLVLSADATTLGGCAGPDTGSTTLALSGTPGEKKLADLLLSATVPGIPVGGGISGTASIALHLKINLLD
jgi:hypothetical protein